MSTRCSCLENPGDGGAWWAATYGVALSRTQLKRLSSSSSKSQSVLAPFLLSHNLYFPPGIGKGVTHTSENQVTATGPSSTGSTHAFSFNTNNYKIYMPHRQKFCNSHSYLYNLKKQDLLLLLLLLNHFSSVQLCVTPQMAAQQAPPSLGFSRQEHWSGLPFPSPVHESEK